MKNIVWTRIDDRLIHGQVMTQWIQHADANEVVIIDDGVAKDAFIQMIMKSSVPAKDLRNLIDKGIKVFFRVVVSDSEELVEKYV